MLEKETEVDNSCVNETIRNDLRLSKLSNPLNV